MPGALSQFITLHRATLSFGEGGVRTVYRSTLTESAGAPSLASLLANKAPAFYRPMVNIVDDLRGDLPLVTFKEALARLPTSTSFRSSHFGEIVACVFAEEVLGLRRLYSKLSLLTAENANAYKMDLLLYDSAPDPVDIVLCEVKSSPKQLRDGSPPGHDSSCYADIFRSLKGYGKTDLEFDLAAARDRLTSIPEQDRERVRRALRPYSGARRRYIAAAVIDDLTFDEGEARVLATRGSPKTFDVDVVGLEAYAKLADDVFGRLGQVLDALRQACS